MPTEAQLSDAALKTRVRELVDNGTLPVVISNRIVASYGLEDHTCVCCGLKIEPQQVEYQADDPRRKERPLHLHFGCHVLWQIECVKRLRAATSAPVA
jgi:hypothetical protein